MVTYTIQLEGCYSGNCIRLNELELYNKIGKINYTIIDAFDSRVGAVPYYWNQGTTFGKAGLNDGNKTYAAATAMVLLYSSSAPTVTPSDGNFVRISVTCTEAPTIVILNFTGRNSTVGGVAKYVTLFQDGVLSTKDSGTVILSKKIIANEFTEQTFVSHSNKFLISSGDEYFHCTSYSESNDVIPAMTSNNSPYGMAISSGEYAGYLAWNAFDKSPITPDATNSWVSETLSEGWIGYDFLIPIVIDKYTITGRSDAYYNVCPKNWTFEGSNDGTTWMVLDKQENITNWNVEQIKVFAFSNTKKFKMYRLKGESNNRAERLLVKELKLGRPNQGDKLINIGGDITEDTFLGNGMNNNDFIDLNSFFYEKSFLLFSFAQIGSGKVFRKTIDTSKIPIKKATIT
ncbi:discoidin domain-containing protein [Paenibacillus donghaensis]|uniref:F5/8 type C domain-containing protein n=1 Tax=Paenibacillus donghaensis TaxID=414771 RepID=A0A2Z2KB80_9BACL|nr:discoidin domain-containing protein [Paenibacillus donghaensis]ASA22787.1 hypothetical protein B9T62_19460 [Paenibacillus donghaensis]